MKTINFINSILTSGAYAAFIKNVVISGENIYTNFVFKRGAHEGGEGRQGQAENRKQALCTHRARLGDRSHDPEIVTQAKMKSQRLNRLSPEMRTINISILQIQKLRH